MLSAVGETVQLTAILQDSNGNPIRHASVAWSSADPTVATVNDRGLVAAVGNGGTPIVASYLKIRVEVPVTVSVRSPDREVLVLLYNRTEGANWNRSSNWLSEKPVSEWENVTVDGQGNVRELWLRSNNLKGQIPGELAQLSHLEELDLSDNEMEGPIPPESGRLAKLERLVLNNTRLTGSIPREIGQLSELKALFLHENRLTGSIPPETGLLANVEEVFLNGNRLTGSIPAELGQLTHLKTLVLSHNQLSGSLPPELGQLHQLEALFLNDNPNLAGPIPRAFLNLGKVRLYAQNTGLCAPLDAEFYNWLLEIQSLDRVASCEFTGSDRDVLVVMYNEMDGESWTERQNWLTDRPIGEWFGVETNANGQVRSISLPDNMISGDMPYELGKLTELEILDLSGNLLTGPLPPTLGELGNLVSLQLQDNIGLTGFLPHEYTELHNLEQLILHRTQICAQSASDIEAWLEGIPVRRITDCADLRGDRIAMDALYDRTRGRHWTDNDGWGSNEYVGAWHGVTTNEDGRVTGLQLAENNLRGRLPPEMYLLEYLTHLDLTGNPHLGGALPPEITRLDLDTLLLTGTQLCFSEDDEFQDWLSTIENRDFHTCDVINPHPDVDALIAFYNATNGPEWKYGNNWLSHSPVETWHGIVTDDQDRVTEINLFDNGLTGSIPPEVGELSELKGLHLESNELMGSIPAKIGQLHNLETLNLSRNDLSGTVPGEMGQLGNLNTLYLQKNMLTGTIPPEIGQLSDLEILRLDANDLEGNIPGTIGQLANLTVLILAENSLNGSIPGEIGLLENLEILDLSTNLLSGLIPRELLRLNSLKYMRLSINRLTGTVPSDIDRLSGLMEFDIRYNMDMSGRLPRQMTNLDLSHLLIKGTSICVPADAEFQAWLQGIAVKELTEPCPL